MRSVIALAGSRGFLGGHIAEKISPLSAVVPIVFCGRPPSLSDTSRVILAGGYSPKSREDFDALQAAQELEFLETALFPAIPEQVESVTLVSSADIINAEQSPYSLHKIAVESMALSASQDKGIPLNIVRLGPLYGPGGDAYDRLIPNYIRARVTGHLLGREPHPDFSRNFIYVEDAAQAIIEISRMLKGTTPLVLEGARSVSWGEVKSHIDEGIASIGTTNQGVNTEPLEVEIQSGRILLKNETSLATGLRREVESFAAKAKSRRL